MTRSMDSLTTIDSGIFDAVSQKGKDNHRMMPPRIG